MFYANIQIVKMGIELSLVCQVKYTKFTLNESILDCVLGLTPIIQPLFSQQEYKNQCLAEFTNPPTLRPPRSTMSSNVTLAYSIM